MVNVSSSSPDQILHKPYWTFSEIVDLATHRRFRDRNTSVDPADFEEIIEFKAELLSDLKEAILCRSIIPVDLSKSDHWFGRYECYFEPTKIMATVLGTYILGYFGQMIVNSSPAVQQDLMPGRDASHFFADLLIGYTFNILLVVSVCWSIFMFYKIIWKIRSKTPVQKLNYLMMDAKFRGFTENFYESETVIDFFNARYKLKIEKDPFRVWKEPFFKRNGDYWIVGYMGKRLCLKEQVVHEQIAYLLTNPYKEIDCRELIKCNADAIGSPETREMQSPEANEYQSFYKEFRQKNYDKNRTLKLLYAYKENLEDARLSGDSEEVIQYIQKIEYLEQYIQDTFAKSGGEKAPRDGSVRAKDSVKKGIDRFFNGLKKDHPFLAEHLASTITRSYTVSYRPPEEICWEVEF